MGTRLLTALALLVAASLPGLALGQLTPPRLQTLSPTNVEMATGSFSMSVVDLEIGHLKVERSYLTADRPSSSGTMSSAYFGVGWSHNLDIFARNVYAHSQYTADVIVGRTSFKFDGSAYNGSSASPQNDDVGTYLTSVGSTMTFTDRDGTRYQFLAGNSPAKISTITYPDGTILTFSYVSNLPKIVSSNRGYAIVFDYSGLLVTAACGYNLTATYVSTSTSCAAATVKVGYSYTNSRLTAVTDVMGNVSHYSYDSNGYLSCPTDPGTTTCRYMITNTPNSHTGAPNVTRQIAADGGVWKFDCSCGADAATIDDPFTEDYNTMTEPNSATRSIVFMLGAPDRYTNENGSTWVPTFSGRLPLTTILPEGNKVTYHYNNQNVQSGLTFTPKSGSGLATIDSDGKAFPSSCANRIICNLPLTVTDSNGNVMSYSYDATHGGVLTETLPANVSGISAVVRHAYSQQYAYVKTSGGGYAPASSPVWVKTEDRTCRKTATVGNACAGGSSDEVVTTYDYGPASGPNNLLLRGRAVTADGITLRTCYTYDTQGNKISETSPRAGLGACS